MNKEFAIKKFVEIRDIPYRIPLSINEKDDCCSGKHILLNKELTKLGYNCRYRVCTFRWDSLKLPAELTTIPHEDNSTHVFLEVEINGAWKIVDATWDKPLSKILPVNEWDGETDTQIAVPALEIFDDQKSDEIMNSDSTSEEDLRKNGLFYNGFNKWLKSQRTQ